MFWWLISTTGPQLEGESHLKHTQAMIWRAPLHGRHQPWHLGFSLAAAATASKPRMQRVVRADEFCHCSAGFSHPGPAPRLYVRESGGDPAAGPRGRQAGAAHPRRAPAGAKQCRAVLPTLRACRARPGPSSRIPPSPQPRRPERFARSRRPGRAGIRRRGRPRTPLGLDTRLGARESAAARADPPRLTAFARPWSAATLLFGTHIAGPDARPAAACTCPGRLGAAAEPARSGSARPRYQRGT